MSSEFSIKDGTGKGFVAEVDSDKRLRTKAVSTSNTAFVSKKRGLAFSVPILDYSLGTADQEYPLVQVAFLDPARHFHVNRYFITWNGGDTNHNRAVNVRLYVGTPAPTANHVAFSLGNLNLTSSRVALATSYLWNTVGNGLTVAGLGVKAQAGFFGQGAVQFDLDGTLIFGYGQSFCMTATPEEAGKISMVISGWFSEIEEE